MEEIGKNDLTPLEILIVDELNTFAERSIALNQSRSSKYCTSEIKRLIDTIGLKRGYEVMAGGDNGFEGEWLYDIVWYSTNDKGFNRLVLAAECEFSRGLHHIKYDFDKLLVTNAEMKIMICMSLGRYPDIEKIYQQCKVALDNYELLPLGTRILLLIWDDYDSGEFIYKVIIK